MRQATTRPTKRSAIAGTLAGGVELLRLAAGWKRRSWPELLQLAEACSREVPGDPVHSAAALRSANLLARLPGLRGYILCFPLALIRTRYLRRLGKRARVHLGLRRQGEAWTGHAWVTVDGQPYGEDLRAETPWQEMASFPRSLGETSA